MKSFEEKYNILSSLMEGADIDTGHFNIFFHDEELKSDYANLIKIIDLNKNFFKEERFLITRFNENFIFKIIEKCPTWYGMLLEDEDEEIIHKELKELLSIFIKAEFELQDFIDWYKQVKTF